MIDLGSPEEADETLPPAPARRKLNRKGGLFVGGGTAVLVLGGVVAFGLVNSGDPRASNAADTSPAGDTVPVQAVTSAPPSGSADAAAPSPSGAATSAPAAKKPPAAVPGIPAPPAGFAVTFADAFNGSAGTGLDRKTFRYDTGTGVFGTGEIETMTDSTRNVFHDGQGHLAVRALHAGDDPAKGWTSGRFETRAATFGAAKGGVVRIQAAIRQPKVSRSNGAGYWPAFWMLGSGLRTGGVWPRIGGINIMETVNGRNSVFGTLHCGVNPGGPCDEGKGIRSAERGCAGCQTRFHTYAVEIDRSTSPERIRWFLDGRNYFTVQQSRVDAKTWADAVDHSFSILFDLAIGGGFPAAFGGGPNGRTVSGGAMTIDYLAVYNKR